MAKYMVMGEISLMSAALRRAMRYSHQNDHLEELIRSFSSLKDILSRQSDLSDLEPSVYFSPFLDVVRSEDTNATITGMALTAVAKFLQYGLIDHNLESAAATAEQIVLAMKKMSYITDDVASDEVVLMKFLHAMRSLLLSQVGCLLTNSGACDLIQAIIKIIYDNGFGVLLKKMAEQTWGEVVQVMFARLPHFSEDVEDLQLKQLRIKGNIDLRTQRRRSAHTKHKQTKSREAEDLPFSIGEARENPRNAVDDSVPVPHDNIPVQSIEEDVQVPEAAVKENAETSEEQTSATIAPADLKLDEENLSENAEVVTGEPNPTITHVVHLGGSVNSLDEVGHGEDVVSENNLESTGGEKDFVSARGVRFTPTSGDRVPYGLSSVKELLKFIALMICPHEPYNNSEQIISLGLELLTIALEVGGKHIGNYPSLVDLVKDDVCKSLLSLLKSERISILVSAMRACFLLFECLRPHLKFQLESYLLKLIELITYEGPNKTSYEIKELAIDNIVSLWRIPNFVTELYLNYDCDLYCSNLFEDLTKTLSKTAFPVTAIYSIHHLSLEALLAVIDSVETHCHFMMVSSKEDKDTAEKPPTRRDQLLRPVAASGKQLAAVMGNCHGNGESCGMYASQEIPKIPTHDEIAVIRHKKKLLHQGTELFNQKPSSGIEFLMENGILPKPFCAEKVAEFLRTNYQLDKNKLGEYISNRKNTEPLRAFVKSFGFTNTRIDEALRMYLESFRLPGEAVPISLVLEQFAEHWHTSNNEPFASADAAFTLAYAIIMLNVDQHNQVVKKQSNSMKEEDFIKNLKGTVAQSITNVEKKVDETGHFDSLLVFDKLFENTSKTHETRRVDGGSDFERQLLSDIYHSIKNDEIVMPAEQTGLVKENYLWKVLLKRGTLPEGRFKECPRGVLDEEVFTLSWSPTLVALSYLLDKCVDDTLLIQKLMSGYRKCATIAAHYSRNEVFDHLIQALYKFTGISSADSPLGVLQSLGGDQRAQLTAKMMFTLAHKHGDVMKEGWKQLVDCSLILYKTGLMPPSMTTADDFVETKGCVSIARRPQESSSKAEHGLLSSIVSYITSSESAAQKEQEAQLRKVAQTCVINFHPEFIFSESTFLRTSALEELVRVLISSCPVPPSHSFVNDTGYDEESTVFALELLVKVVLKNKDRIHTIWTPVSDHLFSLVMGAAASDYRGLLERSVVGMLRVALRLCKGDDMGSQVLQSLSMLLLLKPLTIRAVAKQIVYAIHELLRTSASCLTSRADWQTVFALLSVAGAGLKPTSNCLAMMLDSELLGKIASACADIKFADNSSHDSGVQSDSEMSNMRRSASGTSEHDRGYTSDSEINRTPKHHAHHIQQLHHDKNRETAGSWILVGQEEGSPLKGSINQYTISLYGCELLSHDTFAMTKAAQCLTQLVRDSSQNLNALNIESCIRCIRVFVEASLHSRTRRSRAAKTSRTATARPPSPYSESDSDTENPNFPPEYPHIAVHLLDVMHSLHISCNKDDRQLEPADVWMRCWCPLLQGMARLCCDTRKPVRTAALTFLQRTLLGQNLQILKAEQWEACFNQVLFPLLAALLERNVYEEASVAEETRLRVHTLLSKVFLLHLSPLLTLPTFTALWLTILDFMDKYMHIQEAGGEMLLDAIPESLKNMLLVMDTAGVFRSEDGARTELWNVTWDRVETFIPGLQNELFRQPTPVAQETSPATSVELPSETVDESEGGLPPVMSLEEALRAPHRRATPLAIGGILLQETPLTPNSPAYAHQQHPQQASLLQQQQPLAQYFGQQPQSAPQQQMSSHLQSTSQQQAVQKQQPYLNEQQQQPGSHCATAQRSLQEQPQEQPSLQHHAQRNASNDQHLQDQQEHQQGHLHQQQHQGPAPHQQAYPYRQVQEQNHEQAQILIQQHQQAQMPLQQQPMYQYQQVVLPSQNVAMVSPISSMPSSPQRQSANEQVLDRRLSYDQIQQYQQQQQHQLQLSQQQTQPPTQQAPQQLPQQLQQQYHQQQQQQQQPPPPPPQQQQQYYQQQQQFYSQGWIS